LDSSSLPRWGSNRQLMKKNLSDTTRRRKRDMEENYTPNPMCTNRKVSAVRDSALPRYDRRYLVPRTLHAWILGDCGCGNRMGAGLCVPEHQCGDRRRRHDCDQPRQERPPVCGPGTQRREIGDVRFRQTNCQLVESIGPTQRESIEQLFDPQFVQFHRWILGRSTGRLDPGKWDLQRRRVRITAGRAGTDLFVEAVPMSTEGGDCHWQTLVLFSQLLPGAFSF